MKIAIFAGHVGKDSGAVSPADPAAGDLLSTLEVDITGPIARKVVQYLSMLGIDHQLCVGPWEQRLEQAVGCSVGVDVHADSMPGSGAQGYHVCYYPSGASKKLADLMDSALSCVAVRNRPPHAEPQLYVLRNTVFPVVLLECGFLSSVTDEVALLSEPHQWRIALAVVWALLEFNSQP